MIARRQLDSNEQLLFLCDRISIFYIHFTLRVRGSFSPDDCQRTIDNVQKLHPLLQVRIANSPSGKVEFVRDESLKIPLRCFHDEISSVETHVEQEINTRIDAQEGPLARFVLVQHADSSSTILFTAHHCIGDGVSGCVLMKDFLSLLGKEKAEVGGKFTHQNNALPDSIGMRLPNNLRGVKGFFPLAGELTRAVLSSLKNGFPAPHVVVDADLAARTSMVTFRTADAIQVKNILASCRKNGCSMQGALGAALLLAIKKYIEASCSSQNKSKSSVMLQLLSPVNIRNKLTPVIEKEFGLYVATQATNHRLTEDVNFWKLAAEVTSELRNSVTRDAPMAFMPIISNYLVKMLTLGEKIFGDTRLSQWVCSVFPPCVAMSNLGPVDVPDVYGNIQLEEMSCLGSLSALGAISSFALTFCGKLSWNFVAMFPSLDREHLKAVADDSMKYLLTHTQ
jgi:NRPS condensation-like uncharacterized protein